MKRRLQGLVLILLGIAVFFPQIINKEVFKIILALFLIWTGLRLLFKED